MQGGNVRCLVRLIYERNIMRTEGQRHVLLHTADRLYELTMQAMTARGDHPPTLAIASRFERAAKLYTKASLGEMARRTWSSAAVCYAARGDEVNTKRCQSNAEQIPTYQEL